MPQACLARKSARGERGLELAIASSWSHGPHKMVVPGHHADIPTLVEASALYLHLHLHAFSSFQFVFAADMSEGVEAQPTEQDLLAALKAAKELIDSLRDYNNNLHETVSEQRSQLEMLKEKLYETSVPDDRAAQKAKLQAWLAESAAEKKVQLQTAMLAVENRNLKFEVEVLKTPTRKLLLSKSVVASSESQSRNGFVLVIGAGLVGLAAGYWIGRSIGAAE